MNSAGRKWLIGGCIAGGGIGLTSVVALVLLVPHCSEYSAATPREYFEKDHAANFERILGDPPPKDVTVVNSVVVAYAWRLGVVTTDDWEIEVLAPRNWLE